MRPKDLSKGKIVIYKTRKGPELEVKLEGETVWLTQEQISKLFIIERSVITKHIRNILKLTPNTDTTGSQGTRKGRSRSGCL